MVAVYIAPPFPGWAHKEEIAFLIEVDDGSGCPGLMGVAFTVDDDGSVVSEERFHDIESVRRCYDPATLQPGWWDEMDTPESMVVVRTGTLRYGDMEVEVFNGFPRWIPCSNGGSPAP